MRPLRALTYNLALVGAADLERIVDAIQGFDPDVLALQQVDIERARWIGDRLGLIGHVCARGAVATLTRLPVIGGRMAVGRALVTRLRWGADELEVINRPELPPSPHAAARPASFARPAPIVLDHIELRGDVHVLRSGLLRGPGVRRAADPAPVFAELELGSAALAA